MSTNLFGISVRSMNRKRLEDRRFNGMYRVRDLWRTGARPHRAIAITAISDCSCWSDLVRLAKWLLIHLPLPILRGRCKLLMVDWAWDEWADRGPLPSRRETEKCYWADGCRCRWAGCIVPQPGGSR